MILVRVDRQQTYPQMGKAGRTSSSASRLGVDVHTWNAVLTVAALAVAAGGWASAAALHAATGGGDVDDPLGRIRFLSTAGLAIGIIFVTLILFTGAGVLALPECRR